MFRILKNSFCRIKKRPRITYFDIDITHIIVQQYLKDFHSTKLYFVHIAKKVAFKLPFINKINLFLKISYWCQTKMHLGDRITISIIGNIYSIQTLMVNLNVFKGNFEETLQVAQYIRARFICHIPLRSALGFIMPKIRSQYLFYFLCCSSGKMDCLDIYTHTHTHTHSPGHGGVTVTYYG